MSWVGVAVAGVGLVSSVYSNQEAGKRQDRATRLQQSSLEADQAFRQQQYDDWKQRYGPLEDELVKQASSESPLNLGPTWAKIQTTFDQAGRNNEASMARKGMLGSGLDKHNSLETGRAFALSNAFSQGLQNRDALRERLISAGKQMPQQAGFASQGNQNMAGFFGQQAGLWGNAAALAGQGVSSSLGALGSSLSRALAKEDTGSLPDISAQVDPATVRGGSPITYDNMTPSFDGSSLPSSQNLMQLQSSPMWNYFGGGNKA